MIRRKVVNGPAPSEAAASSMSRSSSSSTGCTARTTNGRVTNRQRQDDAGSGERDVDPHRAVGPVEGEQGDPGDDGRQREGRSITEFTIRLPGKLSLTSTQAIAVPVTHVDRHHDHRGR